MRQGRVVPLDSETALLAAKLGAGHKLPRADSVILATARLHVRESQPDVEVISPDSLRVAVAKRLQTALHFYVEKNHSR